MNIETLGVILVIAVIAAIIGRALAGYNLAGCLITYVLACLGGVAGWLAQSLLFGMDNLVLLPIQGNQVRVSVIGATIGALLLAFLGGLLGRPVARRRTRSRR
ncbi:MAG: hypothetical protein M3R24_09150 [Chloroflexota bacterium]|nr:hypothetical protein [Chloroflexota bacterium]